MARGELPTGMFLTMVSVEPSITLTTFLPKMAAYTLVVAPEGSTASARTPLPVRRGWSDRRHNAERRAVDHRHVVGPEVANVRLPAQDVDHGRDGHGEGAAGRHRDCRHQTACDPVDDGHAITVVVADVRVVRQRIHCDTAGLHAHGHRRDRGIGCKGDAE